MTFIWKLFVYVLPSCRTVFSISMNKFLLHAAVVFNYNNIYCIVLVSMVFYTGNHIPLDG